MFLARIIRTGGKPMVFVWPSKSVLNQLYFMPACVFYDMARSFQHTEESCHETSILQVLFFTLRAFSALNF